MDARQRLLEAYGEIFAVGERVLVDEAVVERMIDSIGDLIAPQAEIVMAGRDPAFRGTYSGADGLREAWRDWLETWERVHFEVEGAEVADDAVVALARQVGVTRHGGVELEQPSAAVFIFAGGRIERVEFHLDRKLGLGAAGLGPQSSHA